MNKDSLQEVYSLLWEGRYSEGIALFEQKNLPASSVPLHHSLIAEGYKNIGNYEQALGYLNRAYAAHEDPVLIDTHIGEIYVLQKRYSDAVSLLEGTIQKNEHSSRAHFFLGLAYKCIKRREPALHHLTRAHELNADDRYAAKNLAEAYIDRECYDKAAGLLKDIIRKYPEDHEAYLMMGVVCKKQGDYGRAMEYLSRSRALKSDNEGADWNLAETYCLAGRYGEGVRLYEDMIKNHPENGLVYLVLARLYNKTGNHPQMLSPLKKYYELLNKNEDIFTANKILNAIECLEKKVVLESKPLFATVTLTSRCNLRCIMCTVPAEHSEISEKTAQELKGLFPYLQGVSWVGGEVWLSDRFKELFSAACACPNITDHTVITNGLLLNEEYIEMLLEHNVKLTISVDGITKGVYEKIRCGARFEDLIAVLETVARCRERHSSRRQDIPPLQMNFVVMRSNYKELESLPEFAGTYGFKQVGLLRMNPHKGTEQESIDGDGAALSFLQSIMPGVLEKMKARGITVDLSHLYGGMQGVGETSNGPSQAPQSSCGGNDSRPVQGKDPSYTRDSRVSCCLSPWTSIAILSDQCLYPDCVCVVPAGDCSRQSIEELWNSSEMQAYRRALKTGAPETRCSVQCRIEKDQSRGYKEMRF